MLIVRIADEEGRSVHVLALPVGDHVDASCSDGFDPTYGVQWGLEAPNTIEMS